MKYRIVIFKNANGETCLRYIGTFEINEVYIYWDKAIKRFPKSCSYIEEAT